MEGCAEYGSGGCKYCFEPYELENGQCKIRNCLETQDGQCVVCSKDYRINNGQCIKPILDRCVGCADGYFVGEDGKCYKRIIGCNEYNSFGTCSVCNRKFVLDRGLCIVPGCHRITEEGCTECRSPYSLVNERCRLEYC